MSDAVKYWSRRVDWPLMMAVLALVLIGLVAMVSAVSPMANPTRYVTKQVASIILGLVILMFLAGLNYQVFRSNPAILYSITVVLLMAVLIFGRRIHGAKSW